MEDKNIKSKILVVEDDEKVSASIEKQLLSLGYNTTAIVSTADDALKQIEMNYPDLTLMDIKLSGDHDGIKIASLISEKYDIPIVYLTGHSDEDLIEKAKNTSPYGYMIKPVAKRELFITLEMALYKHKIDKRLKMSEERYRAVIEDQTEFICRFLPDGKITFVNNAFCQYFNKEEKQLLGEIFCSVVTKDHIDYIEEICTSLTFANPIKTVEFCEKYPDRKTWRQWTIRALFDEKEKLVEYQSVGQDITDRKNADLALIHEKERLSVTLRSISDGVIAVDTNSKIVLMNKVAEELTGYSQEEALDQPLSHILKIIDKKSRLPVRNSVEQVLETSETVSLVNNMLLLSKNETEKLITHSASPIFDTSDSIIGVVLIFNDITEKYKMEEELQKVQKLESLGLLAGGIAHDFNNIITAILGNVSFALMRTESTPEIHQILSDTEKAILQAKKLSGQLLTFAKGGIPIKKTTTIKNLIKESAMFVLRGSNVQCEIDVEDNLWYVEVDEGQINQVVNNLVINADQAMPEGGVIRISARNVELTANTTLPLQEGKYIRISIEDEGIGIPEKHLKKIFDPYFTTSHKGSGLGLATCYSIVKKHNGYISVESELGEGTIFHIYLPVSKKALESDQDTITDITAGKERILVMDDEELIRKVIGKILKYLGYEVEFASDGDEAIDLYKSNLNAKKPFDLVIMDLTVPGKPGGKIAIKKLLEIDPEAKAVVSSGYSDDPIMTNCTKYGFCDYIVKPYKMEELGRVIRKVLDS